MVLEVTVDDNPSIEHVVVKVLPDGRLAKKDAAAYLGRSVKTLTAWHTAGKGPPSILVGGCRFFFLDGLNRYISEGDAS